MIRHPEKRAVFRDPSQDRAWNWESGGAKSFSTEPTRLPNFDALTSRHVHDTLYLASESWMNVRGIAVEIGTETIYMDESKEPWASCVTKGKLPSGRTIGVRVRANLNGKITTDLTIEGEWQQLSLWLFQNPEAQTKWNEHLISRNTKTNGATSKDVIDFAVAQAS